MGEITGPVAIFIVLTAGISLGIAGYAYLNRKAPGAITLALIMLASAAYIIPYTLHLASSNLERALFWYNVSLPGASLLGPAWLFFALQYTGHKKWIRAHTILLSTVIPLAYCLLAWTNQYHGWYGSAWMDAADGLQWSFGLVFWVNFVYVHSLILAGIIILTAYVRRRPHTQIRQAAALMTGALIPVFTYWLSMLGFDPLEEIDMTPASFLLTGIAWGFAIYYYRSADRLPAAGLRLMDEIPLGVIILNDKEGVIHFNPAAEQIFGVSKRQALNQKITHYIPDFPPMLDSPMENNARVVEIQSNGRKKRSVELGINPLFDLSQQTSGWLLICQDITERQQILADLSYQADLINQIQNNIIATDLNGTITYVNDAVGKTLKRKREELVGQSIAILGENTSKGSSQNEILEKALAEGSFKGVVVNYASDGSEIIFETKIWLITDPLGHPRGLVGTSTDVTLQKQYEDLLYIQRDLGMALSATSSLQAALQIIMDAVIRLKDVDCGGIYLLDVKKGGLSLEISSGLPGKLEEALSYYPPDSPQVHFVLEKQKVFQSYEQLAPLVDDIDQSEGLRAIAVMPILDKDNVIGALNLASHTCSSFSEITRSGIEAIALQVGSAISRLRAEEELRDGYRNLERLFENLEDLVLVIDRQGKVLHFNQAVQDRLGYRPEELATMRLIDLHPLEQYKKMIAIIDSIFRGETNICTLPLVTKNGEQIPVETRVSSGIWKGHEVLIGVSRDLTERKRNEDLLYTRFRQMAALREIDRAITTPNMDLRLTLNILVQQVVKQLDVDAADILLVNLEDGEQPHYAAACGLTLDDIVPAPERKFTGLLGKVINGQTALCDSWDEGQNDDSTLKTIGGFPIQGWGAAPLVVRGQVCGALEVYKKNLLQPDSDWLNFFETLAGQAAIAIDNVRLIEDLRRSNSEIKKSYLETLEGWAAALDLRDHDTRGHSRRVAEIALIIGQAMGLEGEELEALRWGALLHDIGKIGIPDAVLHKPGRLSHEEWVLMKRHPLFAYEMLAGIEYLRDALDIPLFHHEKWDGSGYPYGICGEQIPLAARIFAIIDVWDALCSDRPYREAWSEEEALKYLMAQSGKHFDPQVVEAFIALYQSEAFKGWLNEEDKNKEIPR